jgi:geranylgeranylglycerol-phosphate geranylgeranyltransferase
MLFLLGGAVAGDILAAATVALMATLVSIGREIAKDIEDMEGDEGRVTLPMKYGIGTAGLVASAMLIAGVALSVWPIVANQLGILYWFVLIADAAFVYAALIVSKNAKKAQKLCKYAMLTALVAFMLGAVFP